MVLSQSQYASPFKNKIKMGVRSFLEKFLLHENVLLNGMNVWSSLVDIHSEPVGD